MPWRHLEQQVQCLSQAVPLAGVSAHNSLRALLESSSLHLLLQLDSCMLRLIDTCSCGWLAVQLYSLVQ